MRNFARSADRKVCRPGVLVVWFWKIRVWIARWINLEEMKKRKFSGFYEKSRKNPICIIGSERKTFFSFFIVAYIDNMYAQT